MAWVKLDDQAPRNAKILKAGPAAAWMWICGIAHCQAHMSEGFIADIVIPMIGVKGHERSHKLAATLVDCGLFDRVDGGYMVHDYLDFNETKEEALARKLSSHAVKVASGRAGGIASGISRSNEAKAKQVLEAKRSPDPTRPDPKKEKAAAKTPRRFQPVEEPHRNLNVITKVAHEAIAIESVSAELGQIADAVKSLCAIRGIDYNSDVVRKAVDSALQQHARTA